MTTKKFKEIQGKKQNEIFQTLDANTKPAREARVWVLSEDGQIVIHYLSVLPVKLQSGR